MSIFWKYPKILLFCATQCRPFLTQRQIPEGQKPSCEWELKHILLAFSVVVGHISCDSGLTKVQIFPVGAPHTVIRDHTASCSFRWVTKAAELSVGAYRRQHFGASICQLSPYMVLATDTGPLLASTPENCCHRKSVAIVSPYRCNSYSQAQFILTSLIETIVFEHFSWLIPAQEWSYVADKFQTDRVTGPFKKETWQVKRVELNNLRALI